MIWSLTTTKRCSSSPFNFYTTINYNLNFKWAKNNKIKKKNKCGLCISQKCKIREINKKIHSEFRSKNWWCIKLIWFFSILINMVIKINIKRERRVQCVFQLNVQFQLWHIHTQFVLCQYKLPIGVYINYDAINKYALLFNRLLNPLTYGWS